MRNSPVELGLIKHRVKTLRLRDDAPFPSESARLRAQVLTFPANVNLPIGTHSAAVVKIRIKK